MEEKDTKNIGIIKSDNTEGNPWHSGKNGKFTSPTEGAEGTLSSNEQQGQEQEQEVPKKKGAGLKVVKKTDSEKMQVKEKLALKNYFGNNPKYDKGKIKNATIEQLKELQNAEIELKNEMVAVSSSAELIALNKGGISGPWLSTKYPSDYEGLLKSGSFEKKKNYYLYTFSGGEEQKQKMLSLLGELKAKGEKYMAKEQEIHAKYDKYRELVDSYNDTDTYSKQRKDNALWFDDLYTTEKLLGGKSLEYLHNLKASDYKAYDEVIEYTDSYSRVNEPLRGISYVGDKGKKEEFVGRVDAITRAIDGQELQEDMWLRRGTTKLSVGNIGGTGSLLHNGWSTEQLTSLVGTTFEDQGFVSCRGSKDEGFMTGAGVQMYIYCPKTTKALYIAPLSHHHHENEMIIQRGYQYRITKAYKKGNQVCIDCEVLLGTDSEKYGTAKLNELANKHHYH